MKFLSVKFVILLFWVLAFGCSSISELTKDSIGQPISTVIERYGPPTRVTPDGIGGSCYIWEYWVDTGYGSGHLWSTTYWVDSNGIIYGWK